MRRRGYSKSLDYGIWADSGSIGSDSAELLAIVYGMWSAFPWDCCLSPALCRGHVGDFFHLTIFILSKVSNTAYRLRLTSLDLWREKIMSLNYGGRLVSAAISVGGIYGGVFTPAEASRRGFCGVLYFIFTVA
jgi:TRAP-type C4-dicarboxylate transport system permease large subunit